MLNLEANLSEDGMTRTKRKEGDKTFKYSICSPSGTFPEKRLKCDFGGLYINDELVVLTWNDEYPNAQQKILTALLISNDFNFGFFKLYLLPFKHSLVVDKTAELLNLIGNDIRLKVDTKYVLPNDIFPEFDHYQNSKGASLPVILNGIPYHKVNSLVNSDCFDLLISELDKESKKRKNDDLLIISDYLLRSSKLSCHFQFQQEANHYLISALEFYKSLDWYEANEALCEWQVKLEQSSCLELAKTINPIEYVQFYKLLLTRIKNAYLDL